MSVSRPARYALPGLGSAVIAFSLLLIVALWLGAVWLGARDQRMAVENVTRANNQLARVFEEHTVRSLAETAQLAGLVRSQYLRQGKAFDLVQFFKDAHIDQRLVQNVLIVDAEGRSVASSIISGAPAVNIADREHFKVHASADTDQLFVGKPLQTRAGMQWSIIASLRFNRPDGSFGGVVGIALDPAYFSQFYEQVDLGPAGAVTLLGLDGMVRARAGSGGSTAGLDLRGAEIFKRLETSATGSYINSGRSDGVRRIQSYRKLARHPLVVVVGVAEDVALAETREQRNIYLLLALLASLLIAGASAVVARSFLQQHRAAGALRRASDRLIEAQDLAGIISLEWTVAGDHVDWARDRQFLLGPEPAGGYPVYREMVHPDDRAAWLADRQAALDSGQPYRYADYRLVRTDGAIRWISCSQRPSTERGGAPRATFTLLDITERKQSEAALADSERRLRDLTHSLERQVEERTEEIRARASLLNMVTNNIPVMIGYYDATRHLVFSNVQYARAFGHDQAAAVVGKHVSELMPPERLAMHQPHIERAFQGNTERYEIALMLDVHRQAEMMLVPDLRADGLVQGVFVVLVDVTERLQAEAALRAADQRYRAVVANMLEGVIVRDQHGLIVDCNPSAERMFGMPLARMRGLPIPPHGWAAMREDGSPVPDLQRAAQAALSTGQLQSNVVTGYRMPDGVVKWHSSNSQPLFDADQAAPTGVFTTYADITERKLTEQQLRLADERYRAVVMHMSEGVVVRDQHGVIIDCNASAERILGRSLDQMRGGRSVVGDRQVIGEDGVPVPQDKRSAYQALRTGDLQEGVVMGYCRPDGSVLWLSSTSKPVHNPVDGTVSHVFTTFIDITARKAAEAARDALEAQLRESQKMEAMGTLAGGIAHDFNNILGAILGNVALARDDLGSGHPARVSIDEIGKAGARAKHLVQQILTFSRKQPQRFVDVQLQVVVAETLALLRATLPAGLHIATAIDTVPRIVHADATQLAQVLMNLCTNAWHAVTDAGTAGRADAITIRLDQIELDVAGAQRFGAVAAGAWVRLTVSDAGKGMDEATQARIFEPFFTTRQVGEGTGLGLSVAHGIVRSHHGAIAVSSVPGKGTVFEVVLPAISGNTEGKQAAGAAALAEVNVPAAARPSVSQHVLYLDDEASMVYLVKRMLAKSGYRVSGFERPADALDAVRADAASFDVVVTDFNMPGMSGLEVAREIAQIRADLPVVIASGYITDELRAGAERLGVRDLIYKPNTVDELCQAIARLLPPGPVP